MFESGVIFERTGLPGDLSRAPYARVWWGIRGPTLLPEKEIDLGLAEMQFPTVLRGLLALFSLFLIDIFYHVLNSSPPSLFLCKFEQITRPIFSKSGVHIDVLCLPSPPVMLLDPSGSASGTTHVDCQSPLHCT